MYTISNGSLLHDGIDVSNMDVKDMESSAAALTAFASYKKEEVKLREKFLGKLNSAGDKPATKPDANTTANASGKGTVDSSKPNSAAVPDTFPKYLESIEVDVPF